MNPTAPTRPTALNQPPLPNVGKTGFYIAIGRTYFRFPEAYKLPNGETAEGQRLPYKINRTILRAVRSKYAPHVGRKQKERAVARG